MVEIDVSVSKGMNEFAGRETRHLRHHQGEERVRSDVERNAEKNVGRALIELTGKTPLRYIKLKQAMAWRQRHAFDLCRVPRAHDQPPGIRNAADFLYDRSNLVDGAPVRGRP